MTDRELAEKWLSDSAADGVEVGDVIAKMTPVNAAIAGYEAALAHARSAELGCIGNPYHERSEGTKTDAAGPAEISLRADLRSAATVPMPQNKEQAELMAKTGMLWLEQNGYAHSAEPQRPLDDEGLALLREARRWLGDGELSDDLPREYWTKQYADAVDAIDAYLAKPRQQQEPVGYQMTEADGPWKSAVIDALIVDCIYSNEHENDPRKAIADLLAWECRLALDPAVSKEAAALRDSGKMTEADIRQAYEHGWTDAMHVATGGIEVPAEREAAWQASNARAHLMQFVVSGG